EEGGGVARGYRIVGFRAAILTRIAKVGQHGCHALGVMVFQRTDEEEQSAELVVSRTAGVSVKRMDDVSIFAFDRDERAYLAFAIFEGSFFDRRQGKSKSPRDSPGIFFRTGQSEQRKITQGHGSDSSRWQTPCGRACALCSS